MEANLFGPHGRGQASFIAHTETGLTRLDTSWTGDAPAARLRLRAGDAVLSMFGGGLAHFGGVQFGRHFALAPREITHPTPPLSGEAQSASTVELYIDGALSARARERMRRSYPARARRSGGDGRALTQQMPAVLCELTLLRPGCPIGQSRPALARLRAESFARRWRPPPNIAAA